MKTLPKITLLIFILFFTISCDQITKNIAKENLSGHHPISLLGDTFRLQYEENNGAFLSFGAEWPAPFKIIFLNILPVVVLFYMFFVVLKLNSNLFSFSGFSLILGGGISNVLDRIINDGWVSDFMNMGIGGFRTGIFNFADVFIMCGYALLLLSIYTNRQEDLNKNYIS